MTQNLLGNDPVFEIQDYQSSFGLAIAVEHKWNGVHRLIITRLSHKHDRQSCQDCVVSHPALFTGYGFGNGF
jgi:hypothetical protein